MRPNTIRLPVLPEEIPALRLALERALSKAREEDREHLKAILERLEAAQIGWRK